MRRPIATTEPALDAAPIDSAAVPGARRNLPMLAVALLLAAGCGEPASTAPEEPAQLKALGLLYNNFAGAHAGRMPSSETQFLQYIKNSERKFMEQLGVSDPAALLVSPRDGRPLTVLYGNGVPAESNPIVAYESQPVGGTRMAVWMTGLVLELDESEFQKRKPNA